MVNGINRFAHYVTVCDVTTSMLARTLRTCDHGAEDHGDAHLVALGKQVPVVVVDHDAPPGEVEDERRQDERQQLATRRRQRRRRRVGRLDDRLVNAVRTQLACMCVWNMQYVCMQYFSVFMH